MVAQTSSNGPRYNEHALITNPTPIPAEDCLSVCAEGVIEEHVRCTMALTIHDSCLFEVALMKRLFVELIRVYVSWAR